MALSPNIQGALWMSASMAGFGVNDALIKSVSDDLPVFQAMLVRGVFATILIVLLAWQTGAFKFRPNKRDWRLLTGRVVGEMGATCLFLTALFNMPLGNATAIIAVSSLAVTLAAAAFLGESVGWRRYLAIGLGFAGVLIIVRPGTDGFNAYSLAAMGAVCFVVVRDITTRRFSKEVPALYASTMTALMITLMGAVVTLFGEWQPLDLDLALRLAASAVFLLVGYVAGVQCMRMGEVGYVSPFRYTNLIWALILGYFIFAEVPDSLTLIGAALIVGTGLYTLHRERVRAGSAV